MQKSRKEEPRLSRPRGASQSKEDKSGYMEGVEAQPSFGNLKAEGEVPVVALPLSP